MTIDRRRHLRGAHFAGPKDAISVIWDFCTATGHVPVHIFE